ncbi:MAG: flagellar hook-associated protein FlgK [Bryobacteraceae bacterium]
MGNLFGSLLGSAGALRVFEQAMSVAQNNVANSSTPGYVKQRLDLAAMSFHPEAGLAGGVTVAARSNARAGFAEVSVRQQQELYGRASQQVLALSRIEPLFPVQGGAGIPHALDQLFQSFSGLTVTPNDPGARQIVLERAAGFVRSVNHAAAGLGEAGNSINRDARDTVAQINDIANRLQALNVQRRQSYLSGNDAGLEARTYALLESLAELVDFTVLHQEDGTLSVYLGGMTALVMGEVSYPLQADFSGPQIEIRDAMGQNVTAHIQRGKLAALIDVKNNLIPAYSAELDRLAAAVADRINATLADGVDSAGQTPATPMFSYDPVIGAAQTLTLNALEPGDIAAALPAAPGGNGNALRLAALAGSIEIDGMTFSGFYGSVAARIGRHLDTAREDAATHRQLLVQSRVLREELSAVSLDEEAARIIEFQRAYQAAARVFSILNEMAETVIHMGRR